jgi:hypothetical protein
LLINQYSPSRENLARDNFTLTLQLVNVGAATLNG